MAISFLGRAAGYLRSATFLPFLSDMFKTNAENDSFAEVSKSKVKITGKLFVLYISECNI